MGGGRSWPRAFPFARWGALCPIVHGSGQRAAGNGGLGHVARRSPPGTRPHRWQLEGDLDVGRPPRSTFRRRVARKTPRWSMGPGANRFGDSGEVNRIQLKSRARVVAGDTGPLIARDETPPRSTSHFLLGRETPPRSTSSLNRGRIQPLGRPSSGSTPARLTSEVSVERIQGERSNQSVVSRPIRARGG